MSVELERAILGGLMLRPDLLEATDLRAEDFPPGRFRQTFEEINGLFEEQRPKEIDPVLLGERLGGNGSILFVSELLSGVIRTEPDAFRNRVNELRRAGLRRRALKELKATLELEARTGEVDPEGLGRLRVLFAELEGLTGAGFDPLSVLKTGSELQALDIRVDWTVDKLIPERSLTLLHGPGGLGKTWLALGIAKAVSEGRAFLGLVTKQRAVHYIDLENPLSMLIDRVRRLEIRDVRFWHLSAEIRPPKLDGPDWGLYKSLPAGSLLIFDTARASHDGDENDSQDVALVMNRLKEIREAGHDIILLHHTGKASERLYKGSTVWIDLADHVLAFHKVRRGTLEEIDEGGFDPNALLSLGSGQKTRFEPSRLYLTLDAAGGGFALADDPDADSINSLAEYIAGPGRGLKQGDIITWAKGELGSRRREVLVALLTRGEREGRWRSYKGLRGARFYEPTT